MSKAPKQKKAALHYQPYQSSSTADNGDQGLDINVTDIPLHLDPVLTGLSSNLSRNLWDDWNENDPSFGMKFDMFTDESSSASTASTTASPNPSFQASGQTNISMNGGMGYGQQQQQQHSLQHQHNPTTQHSPMSNSGTGDDASSTEGPQKPRMDLQRSLSEDIVNMLDESNELDFGKQMDDEQRRQMGMQGGMFNASMGANSGMTFQQQLQMQHFQQQQLQMQMQMQMQLQQQQQNGASGSNWMNRFGGSQTNPPQSQPSVNGSTSTSASSNANATSANDDQPFGLPPNPTAVDIAAADGASSLTAVRNLCPEAKAAREAAAAAAALAASSSSSTASTTPSPVTTSAAQRTGLEPSSAIQANGSGVTNGKADGAGNSGANPSLGGAGASTGTNNGNSKSNEVSTNAAATTNGQQQQQANGFGSQGMVMPGFMMYSMPMMGNYPSGPMGMNMMPMGMPMGAMQMPMGMNMNMNGMQMPMQMQMQMQMAGMAGMNGMNGMNSMGGMAGMNGMQMPIGMGMGGMPMNAMGINMPMSMGMNMNVQPHLQQQQQVNPQSGSSGDVEMTAAIPSGPTTTGAGGSAPTLKPARTLQPKDVRGGPGFVTIARKPEEPEMSSILKSLMDEEAKKKEKKLERNRDSARESRKKQQTYVETLENGIKRLQINRDLVRSYRWGVTGPGFGPLPCPNSPQMFDWKNRVEVVTGSSEAFANLQNPSSFQSLMRLNRQRRTLGMQLDERERAVWKSFMVVGRQLASLRMHVLQLQVLRTFSKNPLAMELSAELNLSEDQKLQLQCHAQQVFNEEVVQLTALFKVFFALRNEALRLNMMSPSLERYFRETCSLDQLQKLLQWTEMQRTVIETSLPLDEV